MASQFASFRVQSHVLAAMAVLSISLHGVALADGHGEKTDATTTAERLIGEAQRAEVAGDAEKCFRLLREAVRVAPNYSLAHWQLGQMQVDGEWVSVEEAQRRAATNPKQAQYRELRAQCGESLQGQLALARWCHRNDLNDEARFHWSSVLAVDPNNEEAHQAMDLRWSNGRLLSREEIAKEKALLYQAKRSEKQWAASIAKWRRAVSGSDSERREEALAEISALTDVDVIPALETFTLGRDAANRKHEVVCTQISLAFAEALAKIPDQRATESLIRHAVFSSLASVRSSATAKLKDIPQHNFVPQLLSGLTMPIESSFSVKTNNDGSVHYVHSLYREGPDNDWSFDSRLALLQQDFSQSIWDPGSGFLAEGEADEIAAVTRRKIAEATRYQDRYANLAAATEWQVSNANQRTEALNSRILPVLAGATGEKLGDSPKAWWEWWYDHNEYYMSDEHPVERQYITDYDTVFYPPEPPPMIGGHSCFPKGTLVWTKTGQRPIESLELGDLVLAQNVDTGELAYQPVVRRTVRPPSSILKLSFGDKQLQVTGSHPLWVSGVGWRMAKELGDGAVLHTMTGAASVKSIEKAGEAEAYNLAVAEFNTYFVGESGVLVHDVTHRRPTRAATPGIVLKVTRAATGD